MKKSMSFSYNIIKLFNIRNFLVKNFNRFNEFFYNDVNIENKSVYIDIFQLKIQDFFY